MYGLRRTCILNPFTMLFLWPRSQFLKRRMDGLGRALTNSLSAPRLAVGLEEESSKIQVWFLVPGVEDPGLWITDRFVDSGMPMSLPSFLMSLTWLDPGGEHPSVGPVFGTNASNL